MSKTFWQKTKGFIHFLSWEAFQKWILPALSVPGAAVLGFTYSYDWFLIYLGCLFAFATAATGLLRFSEWKFRVTAKDKISFSKLQLGKQITDQGFVSGIKVGFVLFNAALFPIEYSIQTIQTNLSGIYPQGKPHEKMAFTISANAFGWFYDHIIEFHNSEPLKGVIEGSLDVRLKYGRSNNLNQELKISKKIFVKFNDQGDIEIIEAYDI